MVDLIKYFINDRELFLKNVEKETNIEFKGKFDFYTGELFEYPKTAHYKNMYLTITNNRATVKGSIHKYYNNLKGLGINQNYNNFSYCDFKYGISQLQNLFQINFEDTNITNLEFGLNIDIEQDPQNLIDNCILMYDFKIPNRNEKFKGKGDYLEFITTDYSLKIYNKSKQNLLSNRNILRVELKITGSRYLKKEFAIYTLNDLDRNRFEELFKKLIYHFDKLLIVDELKLKDCARTDENVIFEYGINPNYWKKFKISKAYKRKNKFKKVFENVLIDYGLLKTKKQLKVLLVSKYKELMNCEYEILKNVA